MATQKEIDKKSTDATFDRLPPQSIDAEKAVLGSILLDNNCMGLVIEHLESDCFYKTAHRKIFTAALSLYEKNEPADLVTLAEELTRRKSLEEVGGNYYLTELSETVPSSANVEYHARIVLEKYLMRKMIEEAAAIAKDCYEATDDVYDIIDRSEQRIFRLSDNQLRSTFQHIKPIMHVTFETIESFHGREGVVTGAPTGYTRLDELTSGFQNGELIILAGRPSMGKTALSLNMARNIAIDGKLPIGFFSLEMSKNQLAMRMLCSEARVDAHSVRTGRLADDQWQRLSLKAGNLTEAPIFIDDTPGVSVLEMRAKARRLKKEHNIGALIIDYLQLMQGPKGVESRQQEISTISRSLKALARELDVPVIALSQLSRAVESRPDKRPMLSDLRESGAIEQDADVVIFVYRPEYYNIMTDQEGNSLEGKAEIIISKQRNGPVGSVLLNFQKQFACFDNPAFDEPEGSFPE